MTQEQWTTVDQYITDLLIPPDPALDTTMQSAVDAGMPAISVAPNQGKFLSIWAQSIRAKHILEIGTLAGYSTIWLGRALPADGKLISLEINPQYAEIARANVERAGLSTVVDIRVGNALDTLPQLASETFDLVFIDADKVNTPAYFEWALKLTRRGSLIIVDNVIRNGNVIDANTTDPNIQGIRRFNELLASEPRVTATAIQTVGSKGYDGLAVVLVVSD